MKSKMPQTPVDSLVPKPTPKEKKDINQMEESKTVEGRRNRIEIKDEEEQIGVGLGFRLFLLERTL